MNHEGILEGSTFTLRETALIWRVLSRGIGGIGSIKYWLLRAQHWGRLLGLNPSSDPHGPYAPSLKIFIYLFIFGCVGSSLLHMGFL